MEKLFEKSIKTEKGKLKNLLDKLKASTKNTKDYDNYYKQKNAIVSALYKSGVKSIIWNKKNYSLKDDIERRNKANVQRKSKLKNLNVNTNKGVVKYDEYNKNLINLSDNLTLYGSKDVNSDITKLRNSLTTDIKEIKTMLPNIDELISNMKEDFSNVGLTYKQMKKVYNKLDSAETGEESTEESELRKIYNQLGEEERTKFKQKIKDTLKKIFKWFKPKKKEKGPEEPTETQNNVQQKSTQSSEPGLQPDGKANPTISPHATKNYKMNDIVTITTQAHDIDAVYMGLVGEDVQDIINKINNKKFEKSDPFDGVFVMVRNTLPDVFASRGIDILLINENLIGQKQRVKGYLSNGKLRASFEVELKSIQLKEARKEIEKIAASKVHNIEGTLLEKINSKEFKEYMSILNERINIMTFESRMQSDFILVNEWLEERNDFETWYTMGADPDGQKEAIYNACKDGNIKLCKQLIRSALGEIFPGAKITTIVVADAYANVKQIG